MKKMIAVLMILALLAALPFATLAMSETTDTAVEPEYMTLEGLVTEIVDGGFVMEDAEQGTVMVNTSDATVWDGLLAESEIAVDQYVFVDYNGAMTFSLPPQVHADRVGMYMLTGFVTEVLEDGSIMMNDVFSGEVLVHLTDDMRHVSVGTSLTVYHNGTMTLSLPAQVTASHIELISATGVVSEVTEDGFLLSTLDGQIFHVALNGGTLFSEEALPEDADLESFEAAANLELTTPQLYPGADEDAADAAEEAEADQPLTDEEPAAETEIAQEPAAGEDAEAPADESAFISLQPVAPALSEASDEPAVLPEELTDGAKVTVYFNGVMTRSIPARITALEVVILK